MILVGTVAAARVVELIQGVSLGMLPARIYRDVPEIPLVLSLFAYLGNRIANRLRDVLPFVVYVRQSRRQNKEVSDTA